MARSEKKIKLVQVTALRKKYECILEEEKRRKERNAYILGKFDMMRTCTAVVPKSTLNEPTAPLQSTSQQRTSCRLYEFKTPGLQNSDQYSLQEIIKKFILIPKRLTGVENSLTLESKNKNSTNSSDWKSKYDILNELNNIEIGKTTVNKLIIPETQNIDRHSNSLNKGRPKHLYLYQEQPEKDLNDTVNNLSTTTEVDVYPSFKIAGDVNDIEHKTPHEEIVKIMDTDIDLGVQSSCGHNQSFKEASEIRDRDDIDSHTPDKEVIKKENEVGEPCTEKIEFDENDGLNPAYIYYPKEDIGKPLGDVPKEVEDEHYPIDVINVDEFPPKDGVNITPKEMSEIVFDTSLSGSQGIISPTANKNKQPEFPTESEPQPSVQQGFEQKVPPKKETTDNILKIAEVPQLFKQVPENKNDHNEFVNDGQGDENFYLQNQQLAHENMYLGNQQLANENMYLEYQQLANQNMYLENQQLANENVYLENQQPANENVYLENQQLANENVYLENQQPANENVYLENQQLANENVYLENQQLANENVYLDNQQPANEYVYLENQQLANENVYLENQQLANENVYLENQQLANENVYLENQQLANENVYLENQQLANENVYLENQQPANENVYLENQQLANENVCLENQQLANENVYLENQQLANENVCLENQQLANENVYLVNQQLANENMYLKNQQLANENVNQEYQYYQEGYEQEQSVNIGEYEETSTRYDPNYEQQYMATMEHQPESAQSGLTQDPMVQFGVPPQAEWEQINVQRYAEEPLVSNQPDCSNFEQQQFSNETGQLSVEELAEQSVLFNPQLCNEQDDLNFEQEYVSNVTDAQVTDEHGQQSVQQIEKKSKTPENE